MRRKEPEPERPAILSVSALTRRVRELLESGVGEVWVEGEVSNLRRQSSGHVYFTLKDSASQVACVLFAGQAAQLRGMQFSDGSQVQIFGQMTVYEARGNYQIIVRRVQERGLGALQAKFEELKRRLQAEGIFDSARKRPLPKFVRRVGVVTSPTGAAIRDFLTVLHRRQRGIEVVIFPVRVQGKGAAEEIAEAIRTLGDPASLGIGPLDVIVVTRGGGSLEDLWEFNEEAVARAIFSCPVPVVSAVGHEIDFTISDFAADLRAPTPSAAAEILSADSAVLIEQLTDVASRLRHAIRTPLQSLRSQLDGLRRTALFSEPQRAVRDGRQRLDSLADSLERGVERHVGGCQLVLAGLAGKLAARSPEKRIYDVLHTLATHQATMSRHCEACVETFRARLEKYRAVLEALNPQAALVRGFTLTLGTDGKVLRHAGGLSTGDRIVTKFADGCVESVVDGRAGKRLPHGKVD